MDLRIALAGDDHGDGALAFTVTREAERSRGTIALLEASARRSGELLAICSWCKRVRVGVNEWLDAAEATRRLSLMSSSTVPALSHGACETCLENLIGTSRPR